MAWLQKLRSFFQTEESDYPRVSRRHFIGGLSGAAVGAGVLMPDTARAEAEERAQMHGITPGTVVDAQGRMLRKTPLSADPLLGAIMMVGFNFAPRGWATCDGQLLPISTYQALFSLLGTIYGGDGRTTFALPDLRSRFPMHVGQGPGLSVRSQGQKSGAEAVTLTPLQMPSHAHTAQTTVEVPSSDATGPAASPNSNIPARPASGVPQYADPTQADGAVPGTASTTVNATGGNQPHANMPPYQVVRFCIALEGIYPSRS